MSEWINRFRRIADKEVVDEFRCRCEPDSRNHELMVDGALRNMNFDEYYLEDGVPEQLASSEVKQHEV